MQGFVQQENAVSMSRQASPVRGAAGEASAGGGEEPAGQPRGRPVLGNRGLGGEARGGTGQAPAAGALVRHEVPRRFHGVRNNHPRLGVHLEGPQFVNFTPEQVVSLFNLLLASRGLDPLHENPEDEGIALISSDAFKQVSNEARKILSQIEDDDRIKLADGQIKPHEVTATGAWRHMFDQAETTKDISELTRGLKNARIALKNAKAAKKVSNIAQVDLRHAKESAKYADASLQKAKESMAVAEKTPGAEKISELREALMKAEQNALNEAQKLKDAEAHTDKSCDIAKTKTDEVLAAYDLRKALWKTVRKHFEQKKP